jgi:Glu-tRNA(Gln) amidotransferase subunit E-like FAD-binding protein
MFDSRAGGSTMNMADVVIHINESEDHDRRMQIADTIRAHKGVMGVAHHDEKPHLMIVEYDPAQVHAKELLQVTLDQGVHAQLVGL